MKQRAGVILIQDGLIALINRVRPGLEYYVFPGGGVDRGETVEDAARREAHEELGVEVELIGEPVARLRTPTEHRYWRARVAGGTFGAGHGHEMRRSHPWTGTYTPVWMPVSELPGLRIIPRVLATFIERAEREGWPDTMQTLIEWAWLEHGPEQRSADPFVGVTTPVVAAVPEDVPAWLKLAHSVEGLFGEPMSSDPAFHAILEKNIARGTAFVARENWGEPGTPLAGAILWSPARNQIGWLAVAKRWHRRGIGSALIDAVAALATRPQIMVETFSDEIVGGEPARAFYLAHGFVSLGPSAPGREIFARDSD